MDDASDTSMTRLAIWAGIAETLRTEIAGGARPPGDRLPTEAQLSARFGVNRHTVRRALLALASEGLVRSRRGAGAFVANAPADYPLGARVRFQRSMEAAGRVPGKRILSIETRSALPVEAVPLAIEAGDPVFVVDGIALVDGVPVALFHAIHPAARLPGLADALRETGSVTAALAACGVVDYVRVSTRIVAVAATPIDAGHLNVAVGAPLLLSEAVNADLHGVPVEYGTTRFAGDRITLTLRHA